MRDHYAAFGEREAILAALQKRGIAVESLTPEHLSPFDQFHTGGALATERLAALLGPQTGDRVLDIGCGLGGPARMLAALKGCCVVGVDLAPHFVENAKFFTDLTRQSEHVSFHVASATSLPFPDASFDAAWHLHVSMNVADKKSMYREISRILKPGGTLAIHDPVRGDKGEVVFPVPWTPHPNMSYLVSAEDLKAEIANAGFQALEEADSTDDGLTWHKQLDAKRKKHQSAAAKIKSKPPSSLDIMTANHRANLSSGAVRICTLKVRKRL